MTKADQQAVRKVGRAIVAGVEVDVRVWPGWIDRDQVAHKLHEYAIEAREHYSDIDYLAAGDLTDEDRENLGVSDDIGERIQRMTTARAELLDTATNAKELDRSRASPPHHGRAGHRHRHHRW